MKFYRHRPWAIGLILTMGTFDRCNFVCKSSCHEFGYLLNTPMVNIYNFSIVKYDKENVVKILNGIPSMVAKVCWQQYNCTVQCTELDASSVCFYAPFNYHKATHLRNNTFKPQIVILGKKIIIFKFCENTD